MSAVRFWEQRTPDHQWQSVYAAQLWMQRASRTQHACHLHRSATMHVFKVEGVHLRLLGLGYYTLLQKRLDRSTQFGAVGYIITLYSSKSYVKNWGSVQIMGKSGPLDH